MRSVPRGRGTRPREVAGKRRLRPATPPNGSRSVIIEDLPLVYPEDALLQGARERGVLSLDGVDRGGRHVFVEAVSSEAPRCVQELLALLPLVMSGGATGEANQLLTAIRAWKEQWRLRADWIDRAALFTLSRALQAAENGSPPPDHLAYPDENNPADVGALGMSPRFLEYQGKIATYRGVVAVEFAAVPSRHPFVSVEALILPEITRQIADHRRLYEAKPTEV